MGKAVDVSTFHLRNCSSQAPAQCRTTVQKDYGKKETTYLCSFISLQKNQIINAYTTILN